MGLYKGGKQFFRFTFVSMPKSIFGWETLKGNNRLLVSSWKTLMNPRCPECDTGVMVRHDDGGEDANHNALYPWHCTQCEYHMLAEYDAKSARKRTDDLRSANTRARFSELEKSQLLDVARGHRNTSRAYYASAVFAFLGALYMVASGASLMSAINWAVIGGVMSILAMTRAYRCWQIRTGTLFVKGSFARWLHNESWWV